MLPHTGPVESHPSTIIAITVLLQLPCLNDDQAIPFTGIIAASPRAQDRDEENSENQPFVACPHVDHSLDGIGVACFFVEQTVHTCFV